MTQAETKQGIASFASPNNAIETGHSGDGYVRITVGEVINDPRRRKSARIQQKGNSSTEWNPDTILLSREIGIETDTNKMKIGDGITPWSLLPYCNSSASDEGIKRIKYYGDPDIVPSNESYFTVNETGETITGLTDTGKMQTELVIPYKINGKEITNLKNDNDSSILDGNIVITKIILPNTITTIGSSAFWNCSSLKSINIPDSVTEIGSIAFTYCSSLKSINIPNSITEIEGDTFTGCTSLKSINIPDSITSIRNSAFYNCSSLTSINIPNSVTRIGEGAFFNCESLTSIDIPNSITHIESGTFQDCTSLTSINIPDSVVSIQHQVFYGCTSLKSVNIPNSVTSIGDYAFHVGETGQEHPIPGLTIYCEQGSYAETYAKEHNIPFVYTDVKDMATETELERLKYYGDKDIIPSPESYFKVNTTGEAITGLTEDGETQTDLVIPYKINGKLITKVSYKVNESGVIVGTAFGECTSLVNVIMPNSIANITEESFKNCTSLRSIQLSNSLKTIETGMFSGCTLLDNVIIPNSITSIGGSAFLGCTSLKSIIIPDSVKYIYYSGFERCTSLKTITIPNGVPSIGESVFENCTELATVYIPNSVTSIDTNYAFKGCTNLTIYCEQGSYAETFANENNIPVVYTNIDSSKYLAKDNIIEYTPLADYQPATKKYVDDINTVASEETCTLSEPLTLTVVSSDGWTGDLTNGFTHINDNTNNLVFSLGEDTGDNIYQVTFNSSVDATNTNITITVGGSEPFLLYGMPQPYSIGIKSVSNGNVEFIPESTFTGTISNITVKKIISTVQVNKRSKVTDSRNSVVFEARFSNADTVNTSIPHDNVFLGLKSGETNTNGFGNIGLGSKALRNNTSGFWNTGIGFETLLNNTVGSRNVGIGYGTLQKNICGTRNIAIGTFSMINNTTGGWNISIGADNMNNNISGNSNVSIGFQAMYYGISSENNVAVGREALQKITTGSNNIAVGYSSGAGITTGTNNMAIGRGSLQYCENGSYNTTIGTNTLYGLKNGNYNIAIGALAGKGTSGATFKENIFIGSSTGQKIGNNASRNIIIGHSSGNTLTGGNYNIIIGATCEVPNEAGNYQLNIGNLITGNMATGSKSVTINGTMTINNLPTSDPNVAGQLWNDNGTVKVSVG